MLFQTTPAHEELRAKVRAFAEKEIAPIAAVLDQKNEFPDEQVKMIGQNGWMGLPYPKEYGGAGLDVLSYAIAVEELARVDGGAGVILSAHVSLGSYPIAAFGTDEQKKKYLTPLAKGEKIGAFGLTEENAGSDAGGTETTAIDKGDHYLLNGGKIFITNAPKADTYVVFAVTTPDIGTRGISALIVEKGMPGFEFGDHYDKLGIRSSTTAELIFNDVKVPKENLLGKEGQGFKIAMATLDGGRIGIAAQALGIAQGAYEKALEEAKERIQFGNPIGVNQGISFKLADMATKLRAARYLVYSAAELKEAHESYSMEAAMAKMYASDRALEIVNDALQIFGGSGFIKGMDVERAYRDAKITTIYEGTNEIQRVVIASHLLGKIGKSSSAAGGARSVAKKPAPVTGVRKGRIFREGDAKNKVAELVAALKSDGYDFSVGIAKDTPIAEAERVVSAGKGIGDKANMKLIEDLAAAAGAAIGSSRPVAETLQYVPLVRYVGMSGQKFTGNLYIACGISGAKQHLKGIKDASTIVAINKNGNAPIFKNCDYGIIGDVNEILPLLTEALGGTAEKKPAPKMVKMKRPRAPKPEPIGPSFVCNGCAYEYFPDLGDEEADIAPGTQFKDLPEDWVCPECAEPKTNFVAQAHRGL
ncbi:MAG: acyl-CoA dehydrogenase family protein [Lachnospiraceae bacterium]|nr:acyl-CoA dehydrogenase family protein [Lachnospiraceae bacterium]